MIDRQAREVALNLVGLPRGSKTVISNAFDFFVLLGVCNWLLRLQISDGLIQENIAFQISQSVIAAATAIASLWLFGVYRGSTRFLSPDLFVRTAVGTFIGGCAACAFENLIHHNWWQGWQYSLLFSASSSSILFVARGFAAKFLRQQGRTEQLPIRVAIYGAGNAGMQLAAALQTSGNFQVIAFLDDRSELHGRAIFGLTVYKPSVLASLKSEGKVEQVFLAIPSLHSERRRQILEFLARVAIKVMVMPSLSDVASGRYRIDEIHEVDVSDLLGRERVEPNRSLLERNIKGQSVLVTGAAGSIGSELCRQAIECGAIRLVMLDQSEYGLYTLEMELAESARKAGCELQPILGSVQNETVLNSAISRARVDSIYHAAAYKHVPIVERNIHTAISNNVFGTLTLTKAALRNRVKNFVLISTDKAVRPASVMGATKRVCELIVQALADSSTETNMSIVRFGNVLASSGSVIPLFKKQIKDGGPVTVTHSEVTRYFMTINEAAQLVIQAGAMGVRGEVFVLEMGQPIRIKQLAERMICLLGKTIKSAELPHGDIAIEITGLRPGEKLHEELVIGGAQNSTIHQRIFKLAEEYLSWEVLEGRLKELKSLCDIENSEQLARMIHELAISKPGWQPVHQRQGSDHLKTLRLVIDNPRLNVLGDSSDKTNY